MGANCVVKVNEEFFLLTETESTSPKSATCHVFVIRITREQAIDMISDGVMQREATFKGLLFTNGKVFSVFGVENMASDIDILIKIDFEEAKKLIQSGVRVIKIKSG